LSITYVDFNTDSYIRLNYAVTIVLHYLLESNTYNIRVVFKRRQLFLFFKRNYKKTKKKLQNKLWQWILGKHFKNNTTTIPKTNFIGTNCGLGISFENNIFIGTHLSLTQGFTGITFPGLDWDQFDIRAEFLLKVNLPK
jgi:hypothetical protein